MRRTCPRCGLERDTSSHSRTCISCRRVLELPEPEPEPYTGGWSRGITRKPIKEHA